MLKDLFAPDAGTNGTFDWIFEHTCFCALQPDRRPDYVDALHRLLHPGGQLLAIFFCQASGPEERPEQGPPFAIKVAELDRLFTPRFRVEEEFVVPGIGPDAHAAPDLVRRLRRQGP